MVSQTAETFTQLAEMTMAKTDHMAIIHAYLLLTKRERPRNLNTVCDNYSVSQLLAGSDLYWHQSNQSFQKAVFPNIRYVEYKNKGLHYLQDFGDCSINNLKKTGNKWLTEQVLWS